MVYKYTNKEHEIIEIMERQGGSFIKHLAALYRHADQINRVRLETIFQEYFTDYDKHATLWKNRCKTTETGS